ncbi:MAG: halocarboxylic acid dehydrogenase DehI family protein [Candidatus Eremiobacteraeota bacterium]|nr:halocarboxylic acid dehydrogenase DehI family protein [Candidatus Eremiobacteraeota bacterium]
MSIPLIRESEATDERAREAFRDIKSALRVPIVNLIFQAWAAYPKFLDVTWRRLRPSVLTIEFAALADSINKKVREGTESWPISDHAAQLRARAVNESDIARMREIVDLFTEVNPKLAILATAVDIALSGLSAGGVGTKGPQRDEERERPKEFRGVRFTLVEERDALPRVRSIYEDMKATLGLPFIETEYRAMASYPDWLEVWWKDGKPRAGDVRYKALGDDLAASAAQAARTLPHRLFLSNDLLESCALDDAKRAELRRINAMFTRLLPGLIMNLEVARRGLGTS